jgi:hypothetical protein
MKIFGYASLLFVLYRHADHKFFTPPDDTSLINIYLILSVANTGNPFPSPHLRILAYRASSSKTAVETTIQKRCFGCFEQSRESPPLAPSRHLRHDERVFDTNTRVVGSTCTVGSQGAEVEQQHVRSLRWRMSGVWLVRWKNKMARYAKGSRQISGDDDEVVLER